MAKCLYVMLGKECRAQYFPPRSYILRLDALRNRNFTENCYFAVNNCSFTRTLDQFFSFSVEPFRTKKKSEAFNGYANKSSFFEVRCWTFLTFIWLTQYIYGLFYSNQREKLKKRGERGKKRGGKEKKKGEKRGEMGCVVYTLRYPLAAF